MYNGILNIYKEKGYTSHDVVAKLRGILKQKKIGHTGTLDPEATGVLPVCLGKGTKVAGLLTDKDKVYTTTFVLGDETDTQDHTGKVIKTLPYSHINETMVLESIKSYIGSIKQIPPMYSAIKVNGQKLYDLARAGKTVERQERDVVIHDITNVIIDLPHITMTVHCSKGTYIRTLCRDIAEDLNTCGHMTVLERIKSGIFDLETALTLSQVEVKVNENELESSIFAIDKLFSYDKLTIKASYDKLLYNGNKMPIESIVEEVDVEVLGPVNIYDKNGAYMGIYEWSEGSERFVPLKFFDIRK